MTQKSSSVTILFSWEFGIKKVADHFRQVTCSSIRIDLSSISVLTRYGLTVCSIWDCPGCELHNLHSVVCQRQRCKSLLQQSPTPSLKKNIRIIMISVTQPLYIYICVCVYRWQINRQELSTQTHVVSSILSDSLVCFPLCISLHITQDWRKEYTMHWREHTWFSVLTVNHRESW